MRFRPIAALVASIAVSSLAFAEGEHSRDLARQLQGWYEAVAGPGHQLKILIQRRAGDGFEGETLAGACLTAFQNPVPGQWKFEIEPAG